MSGPLPENDPRLIAKRIAHLFDPDPRLMPSKVRTLCDFTETEIQKLRDNCRCTVNRPERCKDKAAVRA